MQAALAAQTELQATIAAQAEAPEPDPKEPGTDAAALVALERRLAEAEAARGVAMADLDERDASIAQKDSLLAEAQAALEAAEVAALQVAADHKAALEAAEAKAGEPAPAVAADTYQGSEIEDMEKALAVMSRRVERARAERDAARAACDAATDMADEMREALGAEPEARVLELRRQLRLMRSRAENLIC